MLVRHLKVFVTICSCSEFLLKNEAADNGAHKTEENSSKKRHFLINSFIHSFLDPSTNINQCWNIDCQLYIVGPVLYQYILKKSFYSCAVQISFIYFFLKVDWASLVVIRILIIEKSLKIWNIRKKIKISRAALFELDDHLTALKIAHNVFTLQKYPLKPEKVRRLPKTGQVLNFWPNLQISMVFLVVKKYCTIVIVLAEM